MEEFCEMGNCIYCSLPVPRDGSACCTEDGSISCFAIFTNYIRRIFPCIMIGWMMIQTTLTCNKDNQIALKVYHKAGFVETGEEDDEEIELS